MVTKKTAAKKRVPVKRVIHTTDIQQNKQDAFASVPMPLNMYRRIVLVFMLIVGVVLLVVLYLSTMKAVIKIRPIGRATTSDLVSHVVSIPTKENEVRGTVVSGKLGKTKTIAVNTNGAQEVEDKALGEVVITNKSASPQGLVATTRFLSKENILFRLDKTVTVPANGSVKAIIHADVKGAAGNIGPSHFTIPGLALAKQEQIFADSSVAMTGGVKKISVVTQADMDAAAESLKTEVLDEAKDMLRSQAGKGFDGEVFSADVLDKQFSIKPNTQATSFDTTVNITAVGVFYDKRALQNMVLKHAYEGLGQGEEFVGLKAEDVKVLVETYDMAQKTATLHTNLEGRVVTTRTSKALDVGRFTGMRAEQVRDLLKNEGVSEDTSVEFFPFWVRCVPRLKDRVYIELK